MSAADATWITVRAMAAAVDSIKEHFRMAGTPLLAAAHVVSTCVAVHS